MNRNLDTFMASNIIPLEVVVMKMSQQLLGEGDEIPGLTNNREWSSYSHNQ